MDRKGPIFTVIVANILVVLGAAVQAQNIVTSFPVLCVSLPCTLTVINLSPTLFLILFDAICSHNALQGARLLIGLGGEVTPFTTIEVLARYFI